MNTTFKRPLAPKRTDFSLHGIFTAGGPKEVGDVYRSRFGGPPFPITQPEPRKSPYSCDLCGRKYDPETGKQTGQCDGQCALF